MGISAAKYLRRPTRVLTANFQRLVPNKTMNAEFRNHMKFDKKSLTLSIDEGIGVDTKSLHHPERARNPFSASEYVDKRISSNRGPPRSDITHITMCAARIDVKRKVHWRMWMQMHTLRLKTNEVPKVIMSTLPLRNLIARLGFHGMDDVGKFYSILNEENGNVISDYVPITFGSIELHGETANIANSIL